MYFTSRADAGYRIALELLPMYRYENVVVVALSNGGIVVGREIAAQLHCTLTLMLTESIEVPGQQQLFGTLSQSGTFTYNEDFSSGEINEYMSEFHGYLSDQKRVKMSKLNELLGSGGIVNEHILRGHNIILVSDGLPDSQVLVTAKDFLKPLAVEKVIICAPIASVEAVDKAHLLSDELHILAVTDNYINTPHYYEYDDDLDQDEVRAALDDIVKNWS